MKWLSIWLVLIVAGFCFASASAEEIPNLIGLWNGTASAHIEDIGFIEGPQGSVLMNITEQKDRIFIGEVTIYNKDGTFRIEKFSGMIDKTGEEFIIVEHEKGFSMGDILGPDEIDLIYIEDDEEKPVIIASNHMFRVRD